MFILRLLYRLYMLVSYLGLLPPTLFPAAAGVGNEAWPAPSIGLGLRQGRRLAMEDRAVVVTAPTRTSSSCPRQLITYAAVMDGHEGSRACDYLLRQLYPSVWATVQRWYPSECTLDSRPLQLALTRAMQQLNAAFLRRAEAQSWDDGSTAVVALLTERQLLVANVGNSKALLCRGQRSMLEEEEDAGASGTHSPRWAAAVLTHDHHPGKPEERARCEAAGASIHRSGGGKYRLMGELEVSRSFGDVTYRDKGVIADPDFLVVNLTAGVDQLLVLASDGVFEEMSPEDVCLHAWAEATGDTRVTMTHPRPPAILLPGAVTAPAANSAPAAAADSPGPDVTHDGGHVRDSSSGSGSSTRTVPQQTAAAPQRPQHWSKCSTPHASQQQQQPPSRKSQGFDATWPETYCCDCSRPTQAPTSSSGGSSSGTKRGAAAQPMTTATSSSNTITGWPTVPGPLTCVEPSLSTYGVAPHQPRQPGNRAGAAGHPEGMSSDNADSSGSSSSSSSSCGYAAWQPAPLPLAQAVAARLLQEAYNRGSMDNLALVVLDLQPSTAGGGRLQRPDTTAVAQQGATATTGGVCELEHARAAKRDLNHVQDGTPGAVDHLVIPSSSTKGTDSGPTQPAAAPQPANGTELQLAASAVAGLVLLTPQQGVEYVLQRELQPGPAMASGHAHVYAGKGTATGGQVEGHWDGKLITPAAVESWLLPEHSMLSEVAHQLLLPPASDQGPAAAGRLLGEAKGQIPVNDDRGAGQGVADEGPGGDYDADTSLGVVQQSDALVDPSTSADEAAQTALDRRSHSAADTAAGTTTPKEATALQLSQQGPLRQVVPAHDGDMALCAWDSSSAARVVVQALAAIPLTQPLEPDPAAQQQLLEGGAGLSDSSGVKRLPAAAPAPAAAAPTAAGGSYRPASTRSIPSPAGHGTHGPHSGSSSSSRQRSGLWAEVLSAGVGRTLLSRLHLVEPTQGQDQPPQQQQQQKQQQQKEEEEEAHQQGPGSRVHAHYQVGRQFGRGHFGEVWRAVRLKHAAGSGKEHQRRKHQLALAGIRSALLRVLRLPAWVDPHPHQPHHLDLSSGAYWEDDSEVGTHSAGDASSTLGWPLVLKRVPGDQGAAVRRSGLREAYFGRLMHSEQVRVCCKLASYMTMVAPQRRPDLPGPGNCSMSQAATVCGRVLKDGGLQCNHSTAAAAAAAYMEGAAAGAASGSPQRAPEERVHEERLASRGSSSRHDDSTVTNRQAQGPSGPGDEHSAGSPEASVHVHDNPPPVISTAADPAGSPPAAPRPAAGMVTTGPCAWAAVALGHEHLVQFEEAWEADEGAPGAVADPNSHGPKGSSRPGHETSITGSSSSSREGEGGSGGHAAGTGGVTGPTSDVWLVFQDAGRSLHNLLYEPISAAGTEEEDGGGQEGEQQGAQDKPPADAAQAAASDGSSAEGDEEAAADSNTPHGASPTPPPTSSSSNSSHPGAGGSGQGTNHTNSSHSAAFTILGPSRWWRAVRTGPQGHAFVRHVMQQLLQAVHAVHAANATHRDIKPENMLFVVQPSRPNSNRSSTGGGGGGGGSTRPVGSPTAAAGAADDSTSQGLPPQHPQRLDETAGATVGPDATERSWQGEGPPAPPPPPPPDPDPLQLYLRLIDFGSSVDPHTLVTMYGPRGPSLDEVTLEYAPPEVLFSSRYHYNPALHMPRGQAHDVWSAGVILLELVLGSPHVFQLPPSTRAALDLKLQLQGKGDMERHLLYLLRGMMELCIYPPLTPGHPQRPAPQPAASSSAGNAPAQASGANAASSAAPTSPSSKVGESPHAGEQQGRQGPSAEATGQGGLLVPWSCTEKALLQLLKQRDPLGVGLEGPLAVRLLQRLLHWHPQHRPTAAQALQHAYFVSPPQQQQQQEESLRCRPSAGQQEGSAQELGEQAAEHAGPTGDCPQGDAAADVRLQGCSLLAMGEPGWC